MGLLRDLKKFQKSQLDKKRYQHVLAVRTTAIKLARKHLTFKDKEEEKAYLRKVAIAALAHDIDKGKDPAALYKVLKKDKGIKLRHIKKSPEVYHAFSGAVTTKELFKVEEEEILNSIRYHTTGRKGMSDLEKIIYLADYIEPGRSFPGLDKIRQTAWTDLNQACLMAFESVIGHLRDKKANISAYTLEGMDWLKKERKQKK